MSRRDAPQLAFDAITIEGGLLPADWLGKVALLQATHQNAADYGIPKGLNLRDELGRNWRMAEAHWNDFAAALKQNHDAHAVTMRFVTSLLRDVFGFTDLGVTSAAEIIDDRHYPLTAQALTGRQPLVVAGHDQRLEARDPRFGDSGRQRSAFGLLQDYLNAAEPALWGIASNGLVLRLARDNASLTRPAWIEADLERIFREERFADFSLLWLMIHASRFGKPDQPPQNCALEAWRDASREEGTRAREQLRSAVEEALQSLGQGFLSAPDNQILRDRLADGSLTPQAYFQQLLRLVYRLIFLLTIEERGLLHADGSDPDAIELYRSGYSLQRLRERSRRRRAFDRHHDLWNSLKPVFSGLAHGQPVLALPALGGLFADDQCADLDAGELGNAALLAAVLKLGWMHSDGALVRINWRDMGPEEFGSVYESLLELVPEISGDGRRFGFANAEQSRGNARKTSGSYYTPDSLVQELLDSALEPVIAQRLTAADDQQAALLSITVCDPACGSGHFLLGAARRLATHLARLRAQGTPSGEDYRHALRDVIAHCIFGVDLNPMARELARMSLWLEAMTPDRPLGFLDHHLQCGDALLGVLDPSIIDRGLPDDAYTALTGDTKLVASALKKRNKIERESWQRALATGDLFRSEQLAARTDAVERIADDNLDAVAAKQAAWQAVADAAHDSRLARLADLYVAAFLLPKTDTKAPIPTSQYLWAVANGERVPAHLPLLAEVEQAAREACEHARVLHWWIAFPQIANAGGFAVMLGNPPWERIKLQEEEFFASRSPLVANAINKAERARHIKLLSNGRLQQTLDGDEDDMLPPSSSEQALFVAFEQAKRTAEAASAFAHASSDAMPGRYPLTGVGDVNTYALFAELFADVIRENGRAGLIVPSGIATDDSTKRFFDAVTSGHRLVAIYSFENEEFIFPAVHHAMKFCLLIVGGRDGQIHSAQFVHFARQISSLADSRRRFALTADDLSLINPNTRTCPVFRSKRDAELTKKLYRNAPVLIRDAVTRQGANGEMQIVEPERNPWKITFQRMLDMSNDSSLFRIAQGQMGSPELPLYEAKMIHQFDHRWATYVDVPASNSGVETQDVDDVHKADPTFAVQPRYRVEEREVLARIAHVPRSVIRAWLACPSASAAAVDIAIERAPDATAALWLAVAQWVAGELFRRVAGVPAAGADYSDAQCTQAVSHVERRLIADFPACAHVLREAGVTRRKPYIEFPKWARQDAELRLDDAELATLAAQSRSGATGDTKALLVELDGWMDRRSPHWLMGWRDITNATNERTVIASVIPRVGAGDTLLLMHPDRTLGGRLACLLADQCSLVHDYLARQKVGGTHLKYHVKKQIPVLPPDRYTEADLAFIVPRVLELTYTAHDLAPWAADLDYSGAPFAWNPERRAQLRAELDAYYARLYGLDRAELRYILDPADVMSDDYPSETFRVLKNNELKQYGEFRMTHASSEGIRHEDNAVAQYRTQHLVLHAFDRMTLADEKSVPYESLLVPAPGVQPETSYSSDGVIQSLGEAQYAGFVLALIREAESTLARPQLNRALYWLRSPLLAKQRLSSASAARLDELLELLPSMAAVDMDTRIEDLLRALENSGCIRVELQGSTFRAGDSTATPSWVILLPDAVELAHLFDEALKVDEPAYTLVATNSTDEQRKA
ncbi:Eco57I restriction-modification methylase domain-containing protein [Rhodanobacter terrae]|uniref:site-specific DNA-methyltransferase (adenine-specific) n=1 Tax=Rhodanobacter terrae TaxID=418647 RepID=A0ABW0T385_9GAMM